MRKNSCVIYDSWADQIINLPAEMAGEYAQAILRYAIYGEDIQVDNPAIKAMLVPVKKQLDKDAKDYEEVKKKRTEAIQKRWSENKSIQKDTNEYKCIDKDTNENETIQNDSVNVNVNESVNVNVNGSVNVNESVKDKKHIYGEYKHVRLTDKERDRLFNDYGEAETLEAIKYLDEYKQRKGYKARDDNLTLRKWVFDAVSEEKSRGKPQSLAKKWGLA